MYGRHFHPFGLVLLVFVLSGFLSCSKSEDLSNLDDTLFVRHSNADMPAYIRGNGSERVFLITLHGGPGGMGLDFRGNTFNEIEETCAVVYFDQRGSGMAQGSYAESGITIDIMAEDVLALVKVIQHKYGSEARFFLLGHSWGATLGIATLLKDQHAFLGWIQVDGTHSPRDMYGAYISNFERVADEQIEIGNDLPFWESVNELLSDVSPDFNADDIPRLNNKAFDAEQVFRNAGIINKPDGATDDLFFQYNLVTFFWNLINTQSLLDPGIQGILSYTDRLSGIQVPALILWGKHDMVVPPSIAQEALDNLGSSAKELVIFENSGHAPMFTEGDLFADQVIGFILQNK